jgi:hypothetical protein
MEKEYSKISKFIDNELHDMYRYINVAINKDTGKKLQKVTIIIILKMKF